MSDWGAAARHSLDLAADAFEATGAEPAAVAEVTALLRRGPIGATPREPRRAPACRHWERLLVTAGAQGQGDLADALRPLGGALGWLSGGDFYGPAAGDLDDKLAYADVVGPYGGLFSAEGFIWGRSSSAPIWTTPPTPVRRPRSIIPTAQNYDSQGIPFLS